jgi:hypothetical protein
LEKRSLCVSFAPWRLRGSAREIPGLAPKPAFGRALRKPAQMPEGMDIFKVLLKFLRGFR